MSYKDRRAAFLRRKVLDRQAFKPPKEAPEVVVHDATNYGLIAAQYEVASQLQSLNDLEWMIGTGIIKPIKY